MGLFGGYRNPGAGIDPHAPKKPPFIRFWSILWHNIGKLFSLNLLFAAMHIPLGFAAYAYFSTNNPLSIPMTLLMLAVQIVISGPTLSGCTYVMRKIVLDKPCSILADFKTGFTKNFGASFVYFLIDLVVVGLFICNWILCPQIAVVKNTKLIYASLIAASCAVLILLFMNFFIFPMQVTTGLSKRNILKNALQLSCLAPKQCVLTTLCGFATLAACAFIIKAVPNFLIICLVFPVAFLCYLVMFINYPVIQKYVINPYYEQNGERNPEDDSTPLPEDERVFTDHSSTETSAPAKEKTHHKRTIS